MLDTNTTLPEMLKQTVLEYLDGGIETMLPAIVTDTSRLKDYQQVSLKVVLNQKFDDGNALTGADLLEVPVVFPSAGGGVLSFPVKVGDHMIVVFSKRSIDEWKYGYGNPLTPRLTRTFDLGDGVAIPGLTTVNTHLKPDPRHVVLKYAGSSVTLHDNGDVTVSAAGSANVSAAQDINLNALGSINITAGGRVNISGSEVHINE